MFSAFVDDFGAEHPQSKQARITVTGLPTPPVVLEPVETGEIDDGIDTVDSKDGEAHPMGQPSSSKEFTIGVYEGQTSNIAAMEVWYDLSQSGSGLAKAACLVEYPYPDGSKGSAFELTRCFVTGRRTGGTGQNGLAMTTYRLRYKRAERV